MKKVVIISGSMRQGNTLGIAKAYEEVFRLYGYSTHIIPLSDKQYSFCNGCLSCDETQECVIKDGFDAVIDEIRNADLIVFGTPTRWRLLSGELKTFLDRLNPFAAVEGYAGLKTFIYAVGQSDNEAVFSIKSAVDSVCSFAEDAGMDIVGTRVFCNLLNEDDYLAVIKDIEKTCKDDVQALQEVL